MQFISLNDRQARQTIQVNVRAILAIRPHPGGSIVELANRNGDQQTKAYHVTETPDAIKERLGKG